MGVGVLCDVTVLKNGEGVLPFKGLYGDIRPSKWSVFPILK